MSWNRAYRPATVEQLHNTTIKHQLQQLLKTGKLPQVFLFAGPKGTGKTSTARILALLINDEQNQGLFTSSEKKAYTTPQIDTPEAKKILAGQSFVVQELDAASHRGIDDIRALKERLVVAPPAGMATVIILDEAHMLTTEAHNALLKMLEEPPAHVLFILATTEQHKIPATIISRCQVLQFQEATTPEIIDALNSILEAEKITYDQDAVEMIAAQATGSFRDAIKIAERAAVSGSITVDSVQEVTGTQSEQQLLEIIQAVTTKDASQLVALFQALRSQGTPPQLFMRQLLTYLHQTVIAHYTGETKQPVSLPVAQFLLKELSMVEPSHPLIPFLPLELALLDMIDKAKKKEGAGSKKKSLKTESVPAPKAQPTTQSVDTVQQQPPVSASASVATATQSNKKSVSLSSDLCEAAQQLCAEWDVFIEKLSRVNPGSCALLRSAIPEATESGVAIKVFYSFHAEQLLQPKMSTGIQHVLDDLGFSSVKLHYTVVDTPVAESPADNPLITSAVQHLMQ